MGKITMERAIAEQAKKIAASVGIPVEQAGAAIRKAFTPDEKTITKGLKKLFK